MILRRNVRTMLKFALVAAMIVICTMLTLRLIGPTEHPFSGGGGALPVDPSFNEGIRAEAQRDLQHNVSFCYFIAFACLFDVVTFHQTTITYLVVPKSNH
jgi:hypothetical protein